EFGTFFAIHPLLENPEMGRITVFNDTNKKRLPRKKITNRIRNVLSYFKTDCDINIIYVDEAQIVEINKQYLGHNYVTDVISFDLSDERNSIGEVYICIQQAERQAKEYNVSLENELSRLAIHGVLHILGFDDRTDDEKQKMHKLEDMFLNES
ncbi:MAG: rRNA maturation RNase YbeY, partial [Candidatus Kapaibacteriota bacterium]